MQSAPLMDGLLFLAQLNGFTANNMAISIDHVTPMDTITAPNSPLLTVMKVKPPCKYIGVGEINLKGKKKVIQVRVRGRHVCWVKNTNEGRMIYDLYTTILKEKRMIPIRTKTNWEVLGYERPIDADDPEKIQEVLQWFVHVITKTKCSMFKGVLFNKQIFDKGYSRFWQIHYTNPDGKRKVGECYMNPLQAALAHDNIIRKALITKVEKIRRLNFRLRQDYLTVEEALTLGHSFIGVSKNLTTRNPYKAKQCYENVHAKEHIGCYPTPIAAARAYDQKVLQIWVGKNDVLLLYPPTNFPPSDYNFTLQEPPSQPVVV